MWSGRVQITTALLLALQFYLSAATPVWSPFSPADNDLPLEVRAAAAQITQAPVLALDEDCDCDEASGSWIYWESTFTSVETWVETYSSFVPAVTTWAEPTSVWVAPTTTWVAPPNTAAPLLCDTSAGECVCGNICCASYQYCEWEGQCAASTVYAQTQYASAPVQTWYPSSAVQTWYASSAASYTAPLRPTSLVASTLTSTIHPTTTAAFEPAVTAGSNVTIASTTTSSGLSGGAIAGIVIGVIIGLILLILILVCCCLGWGIEGVLAWFGIGNRNRRTRRTEEVEYYNRSGARADGRTWYGATRGPKTREKRSSGGIGWGGVLAGLAAFGAAMGLARRRDRRRQEEKTEYSESDYTYSNSTRSSDRRTRDTRRSRR